MMSCRPSPRAITSLITPRYRRRKRRTMSGPRPPTLLPQHEGLEGSQIRSIRMRMSVLVLLRSRCAVAMLVSSLCRRPLAPPKHRQRLFRVPTRRQPRVRHGVCGGSGPAPRGQGEGANARRQCLRLRSPGGAALQHAHEEGMVHRDIKPANLMLSRHQNRAVIKILDFGLSKAASEQNAAKPMIGDPPFLDRNLHHILEAHRSLDARPLGDVRADVSAELAALAAAGKSWGAPRPASKLEGLIDLTERDPLFDAILDGGRPATGPKPVHKGHPATAETPHWLGSRRWRAIAGVSLLALLAAAIVKFRTPDGAVQSDKPLWLAERPDPRIVPAPVQACAGDQPPRPEDPRPPVSASVKPGPASPTPLTTGPSEADRATTKPLVPPSVEADASDALRIATNVLGGTRFIEPVSFGPDILGFNNEPAITSPWVAASEFAQLSTRGTLSYPRLPASRYVFEVELTVNHQPEDISLQLGDPLNACHISFQWHSERRVIECALNDWRYYVAVGGKSRDFALGERISLKLVVGDGRQTLFHGATPISFTGCWPTDCSLRIWSKTLDSAVIHHCSLRPLTRRDVTACGWPIPPTRLALDSLDAAARLGQLFAGYPTARGPGSASSPRRPARRWRGSHPEPSRWGRGPEDHGRHRVRHERVLDGPDRGHPGRVPQGDRREPQPGCRFGLSAGGLGGLG